MKRSMVCVVSVLACAVSQSPAQEGGVDTKALKEKLVSLEMQSWEAWKDRDGEFYQNFLSDDHVELGPRGPFNKSTVVNFVGSAVCVVKSYSVDHFELTAFDTNTAILTYRAIQDTACSGKVVPSSAWVSSLYVKRDGRWQNVFYQQTPESK